MDSTFKHEVLNTYPNTVIVSFHYLDSDFNEYQGNCIQNYFRVTALIEPSCFPDRLGYDVDYVSIGDILDSIYYNHAETPIDIEIQNKILDDDSRWVDLDIRIQNDNPEITQWDML